MLCLLQAAQCLSALLTVGHGGAEVLLAEDVLIAAVFILKGTEKQL
jgi:hypothetical protein